MSSLFLHTAIILPTFLETSAMPKKTFMPQNSLEQPMAEPRCGQDLGWCNMSLFLYNNSAWDDSSALALICYHDHIKIWGTSNPDSTADPFTPMPTGFCRIPSSLAHSPSLVTAEVSPDNPLHGARCPQEPLISPTLTSSLPLEGVHGVRQHWEYWQGAPHA